jgi:hypothetical protein
LTATGRRIAVAAAVAGLLLGAPSALARPALFWSSPTPITSGGNDYLLDVSCPSTSLCVALDRLGVVYVTRNATVGPPGWKRHASVDPNPATALSCPTTTLCVAVDQVGHVVTSTDPGAGVTASWTEKLVDRAGQLMDVSCPSPALCVAVDQSGYVLTSTDPGAGARAIWRREHVAGLNTNYSGAAVDCPTTTLCVALGKSILTSTDPADGASARWSATNRRYKRSLITGDDLSCPSISLCVIVGYPDPGRAVAYHTVTSTDPGAGSSASWRVGPGFTPVPLAHPVISCPSRSLCVALGNATGQTIPGIFTTTNAAAGPRAKWTSNTKAAGTVISCPTRRLCVIAGAGPGGGGVQVGTTAN